MVTTKADLRAENEKLQARITELESAPEASDEVGESNLEEGESNLENISPIADQVTLAYKISEWLSTFRGKKIPVRDIIAAEIGADRVFYRLTGSRITYGIMTTEPETDKIVAPPVHEHEYHYRSGDTHEVCDCDRKRKVRAGS